MRAAKASKAAPPEPPRAVSRTPPQEPPQATFISLDNSRPAAPQQPDRPAVRTSHAGELPAAAGQLPAVAGPPAGGEAVEVASLRRQLADARAQVQSLAGALRSAQAQVKQLQVLYPLLCACLTLLRGGLPDSALEEVTAWLD